jgi:hypothetical protein
MFNQPSHRRTLSGSHPIYPSSAGQISSGVNAPNIKNPPYLKAKHTKNISSYNIPFKLDEKTLLNKNIENKGHKRADSFNNISYLNKSRDGTPNTSRTKINFNNNAISTIPINFVKKDTKNITTTRSNGPSYKDKLNKSNNSKLNDTNNSFLSSNSFIKSRNQKEKSFTLDRSISRPKTPSTFVKPLSRPKTPIDKGFVTRNNSPALYSAYIRKLNLGQNKVIKKFSNKSQHLTHNTNDLSTNSTFRSKVDVNSYHKLRKDDSGDISKQIPIKYEAIKGKNITYLDFKGINVNNYLCNQKTKEVDFRSVNTSPLLRVNFN